MNYRNRISFPILCLLLLGLLLGMNAQAEITVGFPDPSEADQGTTNLDVTIPGGGFEAGASVNFLRAGTKKGGGISVNSVNYQGPDLLIANIDVAVDAVVGDYDIEVRLSRGRKGKGSTRFAVLAKSPGNELGQAISLTCSFKGSWGDLGSDSVKGDTLNAGKYPDGDDKVACEVGGPSTPWPLRFNAAAKGKPDRAVRRVEMVLDEDSFVDGTGQGTGRSFLPDHIFEEAPAISGSNPPEPDLDEMEVEVFDIRPYRATQHPDGIHLLDEDTVYEMAVNFSTWRQEDGYFVISLADTFVEGNEQFQGFYCQTGGGEQDILNDGGVQDVSVYLWPDNDGDDLPDGYTVTTGTFDAYGTPPGILPTITDLPRRAAICSSQGPLSCGNPKAPYLCNFLGYVDMQFTFHAEIK